MMPLLVAAVILLAVLLAGACWMIYGLLRQNGRILVRLETVEAAIEALAADRSPGRVFADRSLAKSRLNRAGLTAGTVAPAFTLPTVDGREVSLADYAGRRLLLVFSDPSCGPCTELLPRLAAAARQSDVAVLVVSRGGVDANRRTLAECGVTLPVALQAHWEISRLYGKFATPIAYLIDEHGRIASDVAAGASPILSLLTAAAAPELRPSHLPGHGPGSRLTH
jgi:peroxiredoxin